MRLALATLMACGHTPAPANAPPSSPASAPAGTTSAAALVAPELASCPQVTLGPPMEMGRIGPAVVTDQATVYAIGGENSEGRLRSMESFGLDDHGWRAMGLMTVPRVRHAATLLDDGQILVTGGGFGHPQSRLAELWTFDTDTFEPAGWMRSVRSRHTATRLADGRVLVIGGRDGHERTIAEAELWDPKTRTWRAAGRLKQARCCHTSTLLGDGRVLVVGGLVHGTCLLDTDKPPCYQATDSVELWDPKTATFSAGPPLGEYQARAAHTATRLRDGRVLIAGGASNDDDFGEPVDQDAVWEPTSSSWHLLDRSAFRVYHSATLLEDGSVLFIGGQRDLCGCCATLPGAGEFASTIVRYAPATDRWTEEGESLVPRNRHGAALFPDGSVLVVGGQSEEWGHSGVPFGSTERWVSTTLCRRQMMQAHGK